MPVALFETDMGISSGRSETSHRNGLPEFLFELPGLTYPKKLNAATALLQPTIDAGLGEKPCVMDSTGVWSYRQLDGMASALAGYLAGRGTRPGSRVLLRGPNSRMLAASWFAVLKLGAVAVTTVPSLRAAELIPILRQAEVTAAICADDYAAALAEARGSVPPFDVIRYSDCVTLTRYPVPAACAAVDTCADDVALIAFTSGSTGEPKGCVHLHRDILAIADTFSSHVLRPQADDLFCGTPPLGFTFGLGGLLVFPLRAGATSLLVEQPGAEALAKAIETHRPTICFSAPTGYRALARLAAQYDLRSLRKAVSAGEYLPPATRDAFRGATGLELIDGLGSTEMLHIFIAADEAGIRSGSTGKVVPGYRAKILDDSGQEAPIGETGRLAVKGPTGCRYLNLDIQRCYVQDGWNITGDRYYQDADGYFWFMGRSDDMIVSAGYKIAAAEVEAALLNHPAVADCAVVGIPDRDRNHVVKAWVVPQTDFDGEDDLTTVLSAYLDTRLALYKQPRTFAFTNTLPRTVTGKLQRYLLR